MGQLGGFKICNAIVMHACWLFSCRLCDLFLVFGIVPERHEGSEFKGLESTFWDDNTGWLSGLLYNGLCLQSTARNGLMAQAKEAFTLPSVWVTKG